MTSQHNVDKQLPENMFRINSLSEIEEKFVPKMKKRKRRYDSVHIHEHIGTELFYRGIRISLKGICINRFKPIVLGLENIPNDKRAIIFAGNHRSKLDPIIATIFLKKPTHWAALLRLFKAEENLFGRDDLYILRKISALTIKLLGAIPIARETDEKYKEINIKSLMRLDNYLKLGSSVGLFSRGDN